MPKKAIDFSKTIIYKIVCNDSNITDCYVGHTTEFTKRKNNHKSNCNNENSNKYNLNVYEFIRINSGWDNWSMIEIEKYPCNDNNESCARERYWLETLKANLNMNIPSRTNKEYKEFNNLLINEQNKQYREINKDSINKKYVCECGKSYTNVNKSRHIKSIKHCEWIKLL